MRLVDNRIAGSVHISGGGPAPAGFPNAPEYLLCGNTLPRGDIVIERVTGGVGVRYFARAAAVERCSAGNSLGRGHIVVRDNDNTRVLRVHHNTVRQGHVFVTGNRISGPFSFVDANLIPRGHLFVLDNVLTGATAHVESNIVGSHLFFVRNTGPAVKHVRHNVVERNLVCEGNEDPLVGHPNSAELATGQCG